MVTGLIAVMLILTVWMETVEANVFEKTYIESQKDAIVFLLEMEENPKQRYRVYTQTMGEKELEDMFRNVLLKAHPDHVPNLKLFHNYSFKARGSSVLIEDKLELEGKTYEEHLTAYDKYIEGLVDNALEYETDVDKLNSVYTDVYTQLEYNATNSAYMNAGSFNLGKTSCTGYSKIMHDALYELGMEPEYRFSDSHYWVVAYPNGVATTIDLATDKLNGKKALTLGVSTKDHKDKVTKLPYKLSWFEDPVEANKEMIQRVADLKNKQ